MANVLDTGVVICDDSGIIRFMNSAAESILGLLQTQFVNRSLASLTEECSLPLEGVQESFVNKSPFQYIEFSPGTGSVLVTTKLAVGRHTNDVYFNVFLSNVKATERSIKSAQEGDGTVGSFTSNTPISDLNDAYFSDAALDLLLAHGRRACRYGSPILVTGESGVGKTKFARRLHDSILGSSRSFVHINCASIPESIFESELFGYEKGSFTGASPAGKMGLVEAADGGTLFLDEISELPVTCQSKLLRFLDEGHYTKIGGIKPSVSHVHLLCATNQNLAELVEKGRFRLDLFYRINGFAIEIPSLRSRTKIISQIIEHFVKDTKEKYGIDFRLSPDVGDFLMTYDYPGNIRELRSILQYFLVCGGGRVVRLEDLPPSAQRNSPD